MPLVIKLVPLNMEIHGAFDNQEYGRSISSFLHYRYSHVAPNKLRRPLNFTGDNKLTVDRHKKMRQSKTQVVETYQKSQCKYVVYIFTQYGIPYYPAPQYLPATAALAILQYLSKCASIPTWYTLPLYGWNRFLCNSILFHFIQNYS